MAQKKIKVKPGKFQSRIGLVVGIIFVLLGVVMVIPTFGVFGIFWTAVAAMIAFSNFKNAFSEEGAATHEIVIEDDGYEVRGYDHGDDIEAKLIKLNSLYEQRLITREEYDEKRKALLDAF